MSRLIYADLLTESGLELLTESGDAIGLGVIGIAGDATVDGGIISALQSEAGLDLLTESGHVLTLARRNGGSAAGTGRITTAHVDESAVSGPRFIRVPKPLHGVITATGTPGAVSGRGHLTLVGKATLHQPPGTLAGQGHVTLQGTARLTAPPARVHARGDVIDELALVLALAA